MTTPNRFTLDKLLNYAILLLITVIVLFPLLYMLSQTFQPNNVLYRYPPTIVTTEPTLQNWNGLFSREDLMLPRWLMNSLVVATVHTIITLLITSTAAYAFARLRFPGRTILFFLLLVTLMIPGQVTFIPNYLVMRDLRLLNTPGALVLNGVASVTAVFLLRQFFSAIPSELEEAAIIDGATRFGIYWRIILPLSIPALVALAILIFQGNWNDLLWPLVATTGLEQRTLPVGLSILNGTYQVQERGLVLAGAIFSLVPVLLIYILFQRWIIRSVSFTSGFGGR